MTFPDILKQVEKFAVDNSPAILTGVGVAGTITTAVLTGRASIKAQRILDREVHPVDFVDKVKLVWTQFIPPVTVGAVTIACIIGANRIGTRRAAALAAAYSLSEKAFTEYKEKVVEKIGEKKEHVVRDELAQKRVDQDPLSNKEVVITGNGDVMFYDSLTGRYFKSNMEAVKRAENEINKLILDDGDASLSMFYDKLGLKPTAYSEEVGFNYENMLDVYFSSTISEDNQPCISLEYRAVPVRNYFRIL